MYQFACEDGEGITRRSVPAPLRRRGAAPRRVRQRLSMTDQMTRTVDGVARALLPRSCSASDRELSRARGRPDRTAGARPLAVVHFVACARLPSTRRRLRGCRRVTERLSPTITTLVVVNALAFAFFHVVGPSKMFIAEHLALGPMALAGGELWQLVTSLFVHLDDAASFFFGLLGLWFVGATLERELGGPGSWCSSSSQPCSPTPRWRRSRRSWDARALRGQQPRGAGAVRRLRKDLQPHADARAGGLVLEARTMTIIIVAFSLIAAASSRSLRGAGGHRGDPRRRLSARRRPRRHPDLALDRVRGSGHGYRSSRGAAARGPPFPVPLN